MGPKNGVVGDQFGTELPQSQIPEQDLSRERNMAKFSKSEEFAVLKKVIEAKIEYYRAYLPGNPQSPVAINLVSNEERGHAWVIADTIINEFDSLIQAYEQAAEAVKDESAKRTGA